MTRRPAFVLIGLGSLVGLVALSSCSSIDKPAASVNGVEIPMDSFESDLAAVQTGLGPAPSDDPATSTTSSLVTADGSLARNLLTAQIQLELLDSEIERAGGSITDADRAEAESQLAQTQAGWDTSPERFQSFFTEYVAAQAAFGRIAAPSEEDIAANYANGIEASGFACVSHILVATESEAAAVLDRLEAGEDFATVAGEVSTDPSGASSGGALLNQDGTACIPFEQFATGFVPEFVEGALAAEVGVPTQPVESQFGFHVILVRPFDDIRDELVPLVQSTASQTLLGELTTDAEVTVSPSLGAWSADAGRVVSLSDTAPP
ncbi:MAG TPA: peptidylprolyl isomerase [Ilumatobacteraceae bacterium]